MLDHLLHMGTWRLTRLFTVCRLNERQVEHQRASDARESALEQSGAIQGGGVAPPAAAATAETLSAQLIFQQFPRSCLLPISMRRIILQFLSTILLFKFQSTLKHY